MSRKRCLFAPTPIHPANRVSEIVRGRRDISADTAIRLGRYFGTTAQYWINLQSGHDLSVAQAANDCSTIKAHPRV